MIPRGEVGLIVGSIGFTSGILNQTTLGEILLMAIATTIVGAVLFRERSLTLFPIVAGAGPGSGPERRDGSAREPLNYRGGALASCRQGGAPLPSASYPRSEHRAKPA